ncbi:MAG: hypothetical protein LBD44_04075 [Spirochaetaceae bacterium]|jgi:hypothetical protein|nr:hypothetical protein [Spirochaetaceae bacterium]
MELPAIMKRLKQVFAQRYNHADGRIGHIWGDRYWSRIVEGNPPEEAEAEEPEPEAKGASETGVRSHNEEARTQTPILLLFPLPAAPVPG